MQQILKYSKLKNLDGVIWEYFAYLKASNPDRFYKIFSYATNIEKTGAVAINDNEITDRIGWLWGEEKLKIFFSCLIKYGFISCKYPEFRAHFYGTKNPKRKIVWLKYKTKLIYIFIRLMNECAIPDDKKIASVLFEHFVVVEKDINGMKYLDKIDISSSNTTVSDFKRKDNIPLLDDIIDTIKNPLHPKFDLT